MRRELSKSTIHDICIPERIVFLGYFLEMATCYMLVAEVALLECYGLRDIGAVFRRIEMCDSASDTSVYDLRLELHGGVAENADYDREA